MITMGQAILVVVGVVAIWAIVLVGTWLEERQRREESKNCGNCVRNIEGVCFWCAGENFGHCTEVSDHGSCIYWG